MKYAVIGFGCRGTTYTGYLKEDKRALLTAVCDKKQIRLDLAQREYGVAPENCYLSDKEFFSKGKLADLLIVSTQDKDHYGHAIEGLKLGYDLLLEKPISDTLERCFEIYSLAKKLNRRVYVCHVLRYAPFFQYIKEQLDTGKYGKLSTINLTENVAFWHQAHSYVRGNWGVVEESTPMLLAKCCHDLDIISWFFGNQKVNGVTSFGSLNYFKRENAPENSADYCFECAARDDCPYDCVKFYSNNSWWLYGNNWCKKDATKEEVSKALENKNCPYARCVYKCNNTAVDHQVVNINYENGATAHLTMTAFAQDCYREIHVHCEKGEIFGNMRDNKLTCNIFGKSSEVVDVDKLGDKNYGHGGGDARLARDILDVYDGKEGKELTQIKNSLISHSIGYAAEKSRLNGGKVQKPLEIK